MELTGTWRAAEADEDLRRAYPAVDFDDAAWEPVAVPGYWRHAPAFASSDGPLLFRHRFEHRLVGTGDGEGAGEGADRAWLTFHGVASAADVWLDGSYVGDTDGYFAVHAFEVTDALSKRREHTLAVEVASTPPIPGGIWRPVTIHCTGPVAIRSLRVVCLEATPERAVLAFTALVDAADGTDATMRTTIGSVAEHDDTQRLAAGENRVEWKVAVDAPPLWWPHALGAAELVDVLVTIAAGGRESDRRALRTGIRQVRMRDGILSVNGERLFLKGANVGWSDDVEAGIAVAREAGVDLLRLHDHVARPEVYDTADRLGLLLWQDAPATPNRKQAARHARHAVDLLAHHPSIALWSARRGSAQRAFEKADASRPAIGEPSGVGDGRDLAALARLWPRAVCFVGDFGGERPVRRDVETLRRLKYRPCGGFTHRWAPGELADACAPVIVVADPPAASYEPGDAIALDVHVVSDLREPIDGAVVHACLSWTGGELVWTWGGDLPADACVRAGTLRAVVPADAAAGPLTLDLEVEAPGVKASNRYESAVVDR